MTAPIVNRPPNRFVALLIGLLLALQATAAAALCLGDGIEPLLTAEGRALIATAEAETPFSQGVIWQADKDGRRIYLLGTMHLSDPRFDPLVARMSALVGTSDHLLVEATEDDERALQDALSRDPTLIFIQEGSSLIDLLGPADWTRLTNAAQARGIPAFALARAQPWYASLALSIAACAMPEIMAGAKGIDAQLIAFARQRDIPVTAVEPWRATLDALAYGDTDWQLDELRMALAGADFEARVAASMYRYYDAGRIAAVWALPSATLDLMPLVDTAIFDAHVQRLEKDLLFARNADWLPKIEAQSLQDPVLAVAVGAAHMIGDQGLLAGLAARGWTITALE